MWYLIGIILSVFLFFLLVLKRNKSTPDRILACWIAVIAIHQLLHYVEQSGAFFYYPHLLGLSFPLPLLHGILLFFYVSALTSEQSIRLKTALPHFIPFALLIVLAIPFYSLSGPEKVRVFAQEGEGFEWYSVIQLSLIVVSGLGYVAGSLVLIGKHRRRIQQQYSNTDKKNLNWLVYLSTGLGLIWLLAAFFDDAVIFSGVVALVLFIGFFGISQLPIFYSPPALSQAAEKDAPAVPAPEEVSPDAQVTRYAKSGLKEEEAARVYRRLKELMEQEALYKKSDLTLAELAAQIDIHPNYLSQVINEREQKNFYHYINGLRVEAFIRAATGPERRQYTLLALAYDCGFNSKSTFNKYFKQHTGKTPSAYFGE